MIGRKVLTTDEIRDRDRDRDQIKVRALLSGLNLIEIIKNIIWLRFYKKREY